MALMPMGAGAPGPLAPPPAGMGGGLLAPVDVPPAGAGALALAPLAEQQQAALDAFRAQQAQEAMAVAMQAIGGLPNPAAGLAQSEPSPLVEAPVGMDPNMGAGF